MGLIPSLVQWVKGSDVAFVSQIQCLAQEIPYAISVAIKKKKEQLLFHGINKNKLLFNKHLLYAENYI